MLLRDYKIPKSIAHTILEFEHFTLINGYIFNNKHLNLPAEGWKAVGYDDLKSVCGKALKYTNNNLKDIQSCQVFEKHKWSDHRYEVVGKHFTEKLAEREFDPEKQMGLLNEFDRDPTVLTSFVHYDHSLWDWNMRRLSVPIHLDYICAQMHNGKYRLKALLEHIDKMDRSALLDISYTKTPINIPGYNCDESKDRCIALQVVFKQDAYEALIGMCKKEKGERELPKEFYSVDSDSMRRAITSFFGFEQYEKPPKDEDD